MGTTFRLIHRMEFLVNCYLLYNFGFFLYYFFDEENLTKYYLIRNKQDNKFLVSDKPFVDYFLCIRDNNSFTEETLLSEMRNMNGVVAVFPLESEDVEFTEYLDE